LVARLGILAAYVPVTATTVALPSIRRGLSASASSLQWVSDALVIPMAALVLSAGVIDDVHGRCKVFLGGLALTIVGAMLTLCSPVIGVLWAAEAIMGAGAAAVLPSSLALISHAVRDVREHGRHIAVWTTALVVGIRHGDRFAGRRGGARSGQLAVGLRPLPGVCPDRPRGRRCRRTGLPHANGAAPRLDGAGSRALAVCAPIFAVIEGGSSGYANWRSEGGFSVAAIALALFMRAEARSRSPMLDLRLFRPRRAGDLPPACSSRG